ncbi:glutamate decarboxylase [Psychromonas sp. psych-6C06]|uniref:glutamate decarboxylase n=1 Tax=Psychromonas sp. psych-6C06 TaxID=2058089 RepID=UPI000C31EF2D|nr:glutamate decarboxylase [Psychromonas sp. psych-6C06]PKF61574.1 glutamate decarboxylase [Psychromonas sp. psych-6C06]
MSIEKHADLNMFEQFNIELPKEFPEEGMAARAAAAVIKSECWTDANPMLNLSSFVTTFMEPEAAEIFKDGSFRNFADPDMYPHTKATEEKCVNWLHELWNGPKDVEAYGAATIGSSEACMLAGLAHKWNWRQAREKAGKDSSKPNMVTGGNVQIVWKKFLKYFDVEPRIVPLKPGQYRLTAEQLDEYVDENTICVVGIAGQTFTGEDDDFQAIHDWLDAYEEKTGISIPMHIDAASGGFVNPFLYPDYEWDFRLPRVQSINASGHKFGLVPPGLGWIIFRERKVFNEDLVFYVNYLGGEAATATLNFSKSSATIMAQYYNFIRLGRKGYTNIMKKTVENAEFIRDRLLATGKFKIMNETQRIPVVALTLDESVTKYNEFDISNKVREHGWILSAYSMPANAQQVNSLRIVVRPHLNKDAAEILVRDIEMACEYLEEHGGNATPPKLHDLHKVSSGKC